MKKIMRIYLYEGSNVADALALICAKNNGANDNDKMNISDLESWFKGYKMQYPSLAQNMEFHAFPTSFTLDYTNYKGETRCCLCIEEIEVMELNPVLAQMDEINNY